MLKSSYRSGFLIIICLLLCGCAKQATPATEPVTAPPTAAPTEPPVTEPPSSPGMDALITIYNTEEFASPVDYPLVNLLSLDGVNYSVTWTTDAEESLVAIVPNHDGTVTVDVNELCAQDTPYTLTATIATADGRWVSHSWDCLLPKVKDATEILSAADSLSHGQRLSYKVTLVGKISSINKSFDEDYSSITLTIRIAEADNRPIRCYGMTGKGIESLQVGDTIAVTGVLVNYGSVLEFDSGCKLSSILD